MPPSIDHMLKQRALIERPTVIAGEFGTEMVVYGVIERAAPCRVAAAGTFNGKRYADSADFREQRPAWFAFGQDLQPGDRVTITTDRGTGLEPLLATYACGTVDPQSDGAYTKAFLAPDAAADRSP